LPFVNRLFIILSAVQHNREFARMVSSEPLTRRQACIATGFVMNLFGAWQKAVS
tara:strand:- start:831 stop:992 length:162 start_codon:yes stop_codon:yes gene_type:complete